MSRSQLFPQPAFLARMPDLPGVRSQRIAMSGGSGTLGRILAPRLKGSTSYFSAFDGDVRDLDAVESFMTQHRPDYFFHLAAVVPTIEVESNVDYAHEVNVRGSVNVASALYEANPNSWFFFASSSHVYAPTPNDERISELAPCAPQSLYGQTKREAELALQEFAGDSGLLLSIGRIFSFSHASQPVPFLVPTLRERIAKADSSTTLRVRGLNKTRDFMDAESVADALLLLAAVRHVGVINIGSGNGVAVQDIARALARQLEKTVEFERDDDDPPDSLVADVSAIRSLGIDFA